MISVPTAVVSTSQDLVRFLLARVDDDDVELKRLARRARLDAAGQPAADGVDPGIGQPAVGGGVRGLARLQAEASAKRRLIGSLQQLLVLRDQPFEKPVRDQAGQMLRALATPYEHHPSYRDEWRPSGSH